MILRGGKIKIGVFRGALNWERVMGAAGAASTGVGVGVAGYSLYGSASNHDVSGVVAGIAALAASIPGPQQLGRAR